MANRSQACSSGEAGAADAALTRPSARPCHRRPGCHLGRRPSASRQRTRGHRGRREAAAGRADLPRPLPSSCHKSQRQVFPQGEGTRAARLGAGQVHCQKRARSRLPHRTLLRRRDGAPALACCTAPGPRAGRPGDSPGGSLPARLEHPGPLPAAACTHADWPRRQELFPDDRCFFTGVARPQPRGSPVLRCGACPAPG